jgi:hypothetical protein
MAASLDVHGHARGSPAAALSAGPVWSDRARPVCARRYSWNARSNLRASPASLQKLGGLRPPVKFWYKVDGERICSGRGVQTAPYALR